MVEKQEDSARFELWQGGQMVARAEGPRKQAEAEILHYVIGCLPDGPLQIKERINGRMKVVATANLAEM